jgi:hypothetical protein
VKSLRTPALLLALFVLALGLGACSRSPRVSDSIVGPRGEHQTPYAAVPCPTLTPATMDSAVRFVATAGLTSSYTPRRIRMETMGFMTPSLTDMGPCALGTTPNIRFIGGHANVFIHGTNRSITVSGQPITFGPLLPPAPVLENGVLLAQDAQANVLEIIWPTLAGLGLGDAQVRVQLARWNTAMVNTAQTYDVVWDLIAEQDGVQMCIKGGAERLNLFGAVVIQPGASQPTVCPQTLAGTDAAVVPQLAGVVQFRAGRLRFEVNGDTPAGTIGAAGSCATELGGIVFPAASANLYRAGTKISVTSTGKELVFPALTFPGVLIEPGVLVSSDVNKNVFTIVWPQLAGLPPGPPIVRLQLSKWNVWVRTGARVDLAMKFTGVAADGVLANYTVDAKNILIPAAK